MYNNIINPVNNKIVSIYSKHGKQILKNYIDILVEAEVSAAKPALEEEAVVEEEAVSEEEVVLEEETESEEDIFLLIYLESLFTAATIVKNGNEVIEYKGSLVAQMNEFEYMKDTLGFPDDLEINPLANDVFKIESINVVIKSLKIDSLKTCELTKKAYKEGDTELS